MHSNLMITRSQVQLGEDPGTMQFIQKIVYKRNEKFVFDGLLIKLPVIDAEPPHVVLLFYKQNWRCKENNIMMYHSIGEHFFYQLLYLPLLNERAFVGSDVNRL